MIERQPPDHAARRAARDPARSFVVQAPAGSGKTELLARRYLRLLASVDEPEEIVAITFTRKAAAEMRERVLAALALGAADAPEDGYARETWQLAGAALARDAERDWHLREHPARLRIQTIDSLNSMLTRQMPLLSRFGQQPGIAERPAELYRAAAQRTLRHVDGDDAWSDAVADVLSHLDNDVPRLAALLETLLARRDQWLRQMPADGRFRRAELEAVLAHEIHLQLKALRTLVPAWLAGEWAALAPSAATEVKAVNPASRIALLEDIGALPGDGADDLPLWHALAELMLTAQGNPRTNGAWRSRLTKNEGFPPGSDHRKARLLACLDRLREEGHALRAALDNVKRLPPPAYTDAQWRLLDALARLLPLAAAELQLVFAERGEVDYAEMALRARDALGDADAPTDLALYLDHRIRHLLVDEFQDTSQAQIELLARLTAGWSGDDGRTLFLVGDPMQSIYRFREAEVGLFLAVRAHGIGMLRPESLLLDANFRSQAGIVEWVNRAFSAVFPARDDIAAGAVAYACSVAWHGALPDAPVQVHPFFGRDRDGEARTVVACVQAASEGTTGILVQARSHLAAIVPALRAAGIAFRAVELEALGHLPVVADLLALTRALSSVADRTAWLAVLRAPWCGLELRDLAVLAERDDTALALHDELVLAKLSPEGQRRVRRVRDVLARALQDRGRLTLRDRVESTWLALGGPAALRDAADIDNAGLCLDVLGALETAGDLDDVNAFATELEHLFAAPDPSAGDAVQIMTLHKAKGLEFDTVILPGLGSRGRNDDPQLLRWLERPRESGVVDLLLGPLRAAGERHDPVYDFIGRLEGDMLASERDRLLYVGATRARRRLHLLGHVAYTEKDGERIMGKPEKGSLLERLWPVVQADFVNAFATFEPPSDGVPDPVADTLYRLPVDWRLPELPAPVFEIRAAPIDAMPVEFSWAGETARHVGTLTHYWLERIADEGVGRWDAGVVSGLPVEARLAALGVPQEERIRAAADVRAALLRTLDDERGRWILAAHASARNELPLSGLDGRDIIHVTLDRTFIADGVRWIIDYKTGRHEGAGLDAFLDREQARYAPQLDRYARLAQGLGPEPVRVALYFPLMAAFRDWQPAP